MDGIALQLLAATPSEAGDSGFPWAVAISIGTVLVGFGALAVGVRAQRQAEREAAESREHSREMVHETRLWEARSRLYEDLLAHVGTYAAIVEQTHPLRGWSDPERPEESSPEELIRLDARMRAFGSERIRGLFESWFKTTNEFFRVANEVEPVREAGVADDSLEDARKRLDSHRTNVRSQHKQLAIAINEELTEMQKR